jgi:hypothetical protein
MKELRGEMVKRSDNMPITMDEIATPSKLDNGRK